MFIKAKLLKKNQNNVSGYKLNY